MCERVCACVCGTPDSVQSTTFNLGRGRIARESMDTRHRRPPLTFPAADHTHHKSRAYPPPKKIFALRTLPSRRSAAWPKPYLILVINRYITLVTKTLTPNTNITPNRNRRHQFNTHECSMNNKMHDKTHEMIQKDIIVTILI